MTAQQGMWFPPASSQLRQAAAASRSCCKQLLHTRCTPLPAAQRQHNLLQQHQQQHGYASTACLALPPHLHLQQQSSWSSCSATTPRHHQQQHCAQLQLQQYGSMPQTSAILKGLRHVSCSSTAATTAAADASSERLPAAPAQGDKSSKQAAGPSSSSSSKQGSKGVQTLDYTTLAACCHELSTSWIPSKVEEVSQQLTPHCQ